MLGLLTFAPGTLIRFFGVKVIVLTWLRLLLVGKKELSETDRPQLKKNLSILKGALI